MILINVMKIRAEVAKLLGKVEVVTMPYVTENARVHLLLPLEADQLEDSIRFLKEYSEICSMSKVVNYYF
jgi:hypothetical protein